MLLQRQRNEENATTERWLLAELWWAETFSTPGFGELARWGLRIIPWAIGSHFGAQVRRVLAQRPGQIVHSSRSRQTLRWLGWLWRVFVALLTFAAGLLASPFLLAALAALLLTTLLPIPQVRAALFKLQLKLASTLGDSFMLVAHPIERASILRQVRDDASWLGRRCKVVAVVAHSQGAGVAHTVLKGGVPPRLRLLFTFGSGLKKLEQLEYIHSSGRSYTRSANYTLIALVLFGLMSFASLWRAVTGQIEQSYGTFAVTMIVALIALVFLAVGVLGPRPRIRSSRP